MVLRLTFRRLRRAIHRCQQFRRHVAGRTRQRDGFRRRERELVRDVSEGLTGPQPLQYRLATRTREIGAAVERTIVGAGFQPIRNLTGHGLARWKVHTPPQIPNYAERGGGRLKTGMVFAIEPMVTAGGSQVRMLDDEWTAATSDGSMAAHFEHTILITDHGPEILTRIDGSH